MISIVLIESNNSGNLGAIARIMKNFGFKDLILIDPRCKINEESRKRAKHGKDILKNVKIKNFDFLEKFDYLIGTTAILGTDYNIPRSPLSPERLAERLSRIKKLKIALVIGRDDRGLTNEEIQKCDFVVTIPSSKKYPTLNISHALGILLYEINKKSAKKTVSSHIMFAGKKEKDYLLKRIKNVVKSAGFLTEKNKKTQLLVWKRLIGKSFMTKREIFALHGFFRKIK